MLLYIKYYCWLSPKDFDVPDKDFSKPQHKQHHWKQYIKKSVPNSLLNTLYIWVSQFGVWLLTPKKRWKKKAVNYQQKGEKTRKKTFLCKIFLWVGICQWSDIQYTAVGVVKCLMWWLQFTWVSSGPRHSLLKFDPILRKRCIILSADISLPFWICVFKTVKELLSIFRAPQAICSLSFQGTKNTKS